MGFNVSLMDRLGIELQLHSDIGSLEPLLDVTQNVLNVSGHVALLARVITPVEPLHFEVGGQIIVEERSTVLKGVVDGQYGGQDFVVHFNEIDGQLCDVGAGGSQGRDGMTLVQCLLVGHYVFGHKPDVALGFSEVDGLIFDDRKVL
jgi:hypothetical protein